MEDFRRNLSGWLPERIESALASYLRFTAIDAPEDIKSFAAHQAACRGSLAHIHLLVKLSRWIEGSSGPLSAAGEDELDRLRDEAETALKGQPLS